jgi:hypothetical protein
MTWNKLNGHWQSEVNESEKMTTSSAGPPLFMVEGSCFEPRPTVALRQKPLRPFFSQTTFVPVHTHHHG